MFFPIVDFEKIKELPKPPVIMRGCEGECCGMLASDKILKNIKLFKYPDSGSDVVDTLKPSLKINKDQTEFYIKIKQYGSAIDNGQKVTIITYGSEGYAYGWNGKSAYATGYITGEDVLKESQYKAPITEKWIKINYGKNFFGWALDPDLDFKWCE